jgi:hypothetical protein
VADVEVMFVAVGDDRIGAVGVVKVPMVEV